jgi:arylsulfatase A-like enzyme
MKSIRFARFCRMLILPAMLLALAADAQSTLVFSNAAPRAIPRRASIIFIQCEGLGYGDLSCYGQTNFQTPNLDKLAAEGIRFTNYFAGRASSPAQAALMLGENPGHLRQRADVDIPLAASDTTVAQMLRRAGYHTGLFGEWDLGGENSSGAPWKKGFDEFGGYFDAADAGNFYADYMFRYAPHSIYDETNKQFSTYIGREPIYANSGGQKGQYIPDLLTKAALNFIRINLPDPSNHYRPFFLLLNYEIPGDDKSQVPTDAPFSEEPWPQAAKNKAAMIAQLDGYIARLQQQLEQLGMTNNAVIFFTSATVPQANAAVPPGFFHSVVSTNDLRVPMIVHWPGRIPAGTVSGFKWSAQDFLPTAAQIGFAKTPGKIDGQSVLPELIGDQSPAP